MGQKKKNRGKLPAHIVLESGLSRMGTGIAQSVARLASSYVYISDMQVRIPLTTLLKIEEKKKHFLIVLSVGSINIWTVTFRVRWFHRLIFADR